MNFIVVEKFLQGKRDNSNDCEDIYVYTDHFVAVIDGATNVSGRKINGTTPGRLAAELIKRAIEELEPACTLSEMLTFINKRMQAAYQREGIVKEMEEHRWMAPSASLVVYSNFYQEIWQIGDCQMMINDSLYKHEKHLDSITAEARSLYLEAELKKGKSIEDLLKRDTGWEFIQPLIKQQYYLQNDTDNQYGYDVINGFPVDIQQTIVTEVPEDTEYIVLASDGYPFLKPTLEKSEEALAALLEQDPLCFRSYKSSKGLVKGNKSFDDRTFVKIKLQHES
ncbi:hypothetical protein [Sediminibacillus albus]|uniref:Protein phosphatase 2C n=1 Tax=Sediminibacillus albus TaxID=407036 RepID=A0A1G8YGH2_9BACI|nr:hypothetical protein [Sediminibacillus albus]SDK01747.1 hypothetical protein SAMN05216243_1597 [Sediminibacillus albus]